MAETKHAQRRKHPRIKILKGMFVGWKSPGRQTVSRAQDMGMGGLFLYTPNPPAVGTAIEMVFDVATGEIRARGMVRYQVPGTGMGLQFVQMRPEDRTKLDQFLAAQQTASGGEPESKPANPAAQASGGRASKPAPEERPSFEREVRELLELTQKGTYYQVFGVAADATTPEIKKSFYSLARRFHPDHHMTKGEVIGSLQRLMDVVTQAYRTLTDEQRRAAYDKSLASGGTFNLNRGVTESRETVEECLAKANECLRARNFGGSIVWLRKCVEISPNDAKYHAMLARSLGTVVQYRNEAIKHFETAIELDPWNVRAYFQFAELCEKMQLQSRARTLYSKILEIDPTHSKALARLAELSHQAKGGEASVVSRIFGKKS